MSAVLLVPLLPLIAALIVVVGSDSTRHKRARMAAWPIGADFCGAIATLYIVATGSRSPTRSLSDIDSRIPLSNASDSCIGIKH